MVTRAGILPLTILKERNQTWNFPGVLFVEVWLCKFISFISDLNFVVPTEQIIVGDRAISDGNKY
jgi:hypothetical protein